MADTTTVVGPVLDSTGVAPLESHLLFELSRAGRDDDNDTVIAQTPITADIAEADGAMSVDLWPNDDDLRGTSYKVTLVRRGAVDIRSFVIGWIEVPTSASDVSLVSLIADTPAAPSLAQYEAALANAVLDAETAAAASGSGSATAAAASAAEASGYADDASASATAAAASATAAATSESNASASATAAASSAASIAAAASEITENSGDISDIQGKEAHETLAASFWRAMTVGPEKSTDEKAITLDDTVPYWLSAGDAGRTVRATVNGVWLNAKNVAVGSGRGCLIDVEDGGSATVELYCGPDGAWRGFSQKTLRFSAGALVRVWRTAQNEYHAVDMYGSTPTEAGDTPAPHDYTVVVTGQSLANRLIAHAGLYGLQEWFRETYGASRPSIWWVNAAVGASAVPKGYATDTSNYWWDQDTGSAGPNTTAALSLISSETALTGVPAPSLIINQIGETESYYMGTTLDGKLLTLPIAYNARVDWLDHMRTQLGDATLPLIEVPLGIKDWDSGGPDGAFTGMRYVSLAWAEYDANVHLGPPIYDLAAIFDDVHPGYAGQIVEGLRLAPQIDNLINGGTNDLWPVASNVEELESGLKYRVTIPKVNYLIERPTIGLEGFAVFASGADITTATPLEVDSYAWGYSAGPPEVRTLTITLASASPGALVMYLDGRGGADSGRTDMRTLRFVRELAKVPAGTPWPNYMPLGHFFGSDGMTAPAEPT